MYRNWILICALLLLSGGTASAQESGLLLGIRYQEPIPDIPPYYAGQADSLSRTVYSTLLIVREGDRVEVAAEREALLVPRGSGFWRVGTKRSIYNDWVEDFVWSAPDGAPPRYPGIQTYNGEYCEGTRAQRVLYAGPRHLALEQYSGGYCEGAAHPWRFNTLAVVPLDSTTHIGLYVSDVLGMDGQHALFAAADSFLTEVVPEEERFEYSEIPDEANWAVTREEGEWIVLGRLDAADASYSAFADFRLPIAPPASLVGHNQLHPGWESVVAFAPDAVDAVSSPTRDLLVLVRRDSLTVHPVDGDTIGSAQLAWPLPSGARPALTRWAVGPRLRRWVDYMERKEVQDRSNMYAQ